MRKNRRNNNLSSRNFINVKILLLIGGGLIMISGVLYIFGITLHKFQSPPSVFANPYLRQNYFVDIEEKLHSKGMAVESQQLSVDKSILTIKLQKGPEVRLSDQQDIDWQISSLQSIMYKLTIENKQPKLIDFRFGKPIVKY